MRWTLPTSQRQPSGPYIGPFTTTLSGIVRSKSSSVSTDTSMHNMQEDRLMATAPDLDKATEFIWSTARLLDRRRFAYVFLDGNSQDVLTALRPYQNADGGFGSGLEPDIRGPVSQPVPTWTALSILDETGTMGDPIVHSICDYLLSITAREGGVPFVLPSARDYPHAPWWETEDIPPASLNPTAPI